jgi:hypothetical protein
VGVHACMHILLKLKCKNNDLTFFDLPDCLYSEGYSKVWLVWSTLEASHFGIMAGER